MNRYQTLERRLGALIVDLIVLVAPLYVLDLSITALGISGILLTPWLLISNFANAVYHILLQGWYGQTLGKMLFRVKVVREDDESPISMYEAYLREIPTLVFAVIAFANEVFIVLSGGAVIRTDPTPVDYFLMFIALPWLIAEIVSALKTAKRRAIHDLIAGTVVIRTDLAEEPRD